MLRLSGEAQRVPETVRESEAGIVYCSWLTMRLWGFFHRERVPRPTEESEFVGPYQSWNERHDYQTRHQRHQCLPRLGRRRWAFGFLCEKRELVLEFALGLRDIAAQALDHIHQAPPSPHQPLALRPPPANAHPLPPSSLLAPALQHRRRPPVLKVGLQVGEVGE